jgi:hypothetical protein
MLPHSVSSPRAPRRSRIWLRLATSGAGLLLAASSLHAALPVGAQTLAPIDNHGFTHDSRLDDIFAIGLDDRQANMLDGLLQLNAGTARIEGLDDILSQAQGIGLDDHSLADMLEDADAIVPDRQLEVGDDRLTGAPEQQPGDVRQEDRGAQPDDVQQEDRGTEPNDVRQEDRDAQPGDVQQEDRGVQPGDVRQEDRGTEPNDVRQEDRPATTVVTTTTTAAPATSRGSDDGAAGTYYSAPASSTPASTPASATVTSSSNSSSSSSKSTTTTSSTSSSGHGGGGHDDPAGHH